MKNVASLDDAIESLRNCLYRRIQRPDGSVYFEFVPKVHMGGFGIETYESGQAPCVVLDPADAAAGPALATDGPANVTRLMHHRVRVGAGRHVLWARAVAKPRRLVNGCVVWDGRVVDVREVREGDDPLDGLPAPDAPGCTAHGLVKPAESLDAVHDLVDRFVSEGAIDARAAAAIKSCLENVALRFVVAEAAMPDRSRLAASADAGAPPQDLTQRQRQIMELVADGLSNKMIAQRLKIAPGTVKTHVAAVLRALGASRRIDIRRRREALR